MCSTYVRFGYVVGVMWEFGVLRKGWTFIFIISDDIEKIVVDSKGFYVKITILLCLLVLVIVWLHLNVTRTRYQALRPIIEKSFTVTPMEPSTKLRFYTRLQTLRTGRNNLMYAILYGSFD